MQMNVFTENKSVVKLRLLQVFVVSELKTKYYIWIEYTVTVCCRCNELFISVFLPRFLSSLLQDSLGCGYWRILADEISDSLSKSSTTVEVTALMQAKGVFVALQYKYMPSTYIMGLLLRMH